MSIKKSIDSGDAGAIRHSHDAGSLVVPNLKRGTTVRYEGAEQVINYVILREGDIFVHLYDVPFDVPAKRLNAPPKQLMLPSQAWRNRRAA